MKKLYKLFIGLMVLGTAANAQTVFESNLSSWASGDPTDWMGSSSSITSANVIEVAAISYGTSAAQLKNTGTSHKRFTTQNVAVTAGGTYDIKMWVKAAAGQLRTSHYNVTGGSYGTYNNYFDLSVESAGNMVMLSQTVTVAGTCDTAQFIISLHSTDGVTDVVLDSVAIVSSTPPVGTPYSIYQIQFSTTPPYDSPHMGEFVETTGIVTAVQYNGYYLQDGNGAYNGIFVLDYSNVPTVGDNVTITGDVDEYFNYTEIKNVITHTVNSIGNTLPNPAVLTSLGANDEQYEGVLVRVNGATCTADTTGSGVGEWIINDGTGGLIVDDKMYVYAPVLSLSYNVTGIMDYSFGNFKLLPRDVNDVQVATAIEEFHNVEVSVYPNPVRDFISFELNINNYVVQLFDVTGKTIIQRSSVSNKLKMSTSDLNNGVYFYSIYDKDGGLISTNKFIVAK